MINTTTLMSYILIFKTTVVAETDKTVITPTMDNFFGKGNWTIDLGDCDKVLRVCANQDLTETVILLLESMGYACAVLTY